MDQALLAPGEADLDHLEAILVEARRVEVLQPLLVHRDDALHVMADHAQHAIGRREQVHLAADGQTDFSIALLQNVPGGACGSADDFAAVRSGARAGYRMVRFAAAFTNVEYVGNLFVAVGLSGMIETSPDGKEWTTRDNNFESSAIYSVVGGWAT